MDEHRELQLVAMVHHYKLDDTYHNLDRWYYVHIHIEFHFYDHLHFWYIYLHDHYNGNYESREEKKKISLVNIDS